MKKIYYLYLLLLSVVLSLCCCAKTQHDVPDRAAARAELSVDAARTFFETQIAALGTRSSSSPMPFVPGDVAPDWAAAQASVCERLSSVDIPVRTQYAYRVIRQDAAGRSYAVDASTKLVVVKSPKLDTLALYIRVCIPDEAYAALYDGAICDMTLNCEDRYDYCGLEYYATLEGIPVAVAKYSDGNYTAGVFLADTSLSENERGRRFAALLGNMWIVPGGLGPLTRVNGEWDYGAPGTTFIDSKGGIYIYVDTDGDGKSDAVTMVWNSGINFNDGGGSSSGGDGGNPFGPGPGSGPGLGPGPGSGTGPGTPDGGSSGGGSGDGDGGNTGPTPPKGDPIVVEPHYPFFPLDPLPFKPITPDIFPPDKPDDPDKPGDQSEKPCFSADGLRANPLISMEILGTKNNGKSGGRYGNGRGRMHNGIDLNASIGTPVYAMFGGVVLYAIDKYDPRVQYKEYAVLFGLDGKNNYDAGNRIAIESDTPNGKILIKYFHLDGISVKAGIRVDALQEIGYSGATGSACCLQSAGPHLHLEVSVNGKRVDPESYLYTQFDAAGNAVTKDCNE